MPLTNPTAENRRTNLARLIADADSQADFARKVDKDRRQISAWTTGRKAIADETAREIEAACKKEPGWLDREHSVASQSVHHDSRIQSQPSRLDIDKMRDAMTLLRHLAELRDVPELVSDPVALSLAYDFVVEFDTPLTNDNVLDITKRLAARLKGDTSATQERSKTA